MGTTRRRGSLRYGVVGLGFIARLHAAALQRLSGWGGLELTLVAAAEINASAVKEFHQPPPRVTTDYRDVTGADDVDVVIVAVPNDQHAAIAIDAIRNGKFVVCEKPLASKLGDARLIHEAAMASGRDHCVSFVFRTWPTVALAKQMIEGGEIGEVFGYRGHMLHGHALDPAYPVSWRMEPGVSGGGALVDIGSHAIDIARHLVGDVEAVAALSRTVVPERPSADGSRQVPVSIDDHSAVFLKFKSGATGQVLASWAACGESTDIAFEVLGTRGALRFSWRRSEELSVARLGEHPQTIVIDRNHPDGGLRFPVPGLGLGYVDAFVSMHRRVLDRVAGGGAVTYPTLSEAWQCALTVDAAQRSAAEGGSWQLVAPSSGARPMPPHPTSESNGD